MKGGNTLRTLLHYFLQSLFSCRLIVRTELENGTEKYRQKYDAMMKPSQFTSIALKNPARSINQRITWECSFSLWKIKRQTPGNRTHFAAECTKALINRHKSASHAPIKISEFSFIVWRLFTHSVWLCAFFCLVCRCSAIIIILSLIHFGHHTAGYDFIPFQSCLYISINFFLFLLIPFRRWHWNHSLEHVSAAVLFSSRLSICGKFKI